MMSIFIHPHVFVLWTWKWLKTQKKIFCLSGVLCCSVIKIFQESIRTFSILTSLQRFSDILIYKKQKRVTGQTFERSCGFLWTVHVSVVFSWMCPLCLRPLFIVYVKISAKQKFINTEKQEWLKRSCLLLLNIPHPCRDGNPEILRKFVLRRQGSTIWNHKVSAPKSLKPKSFFYNG